MSELDALLRTLSGDDEWSRHRTLERLRSDGVPADWLSDLVTALSDDGDATRRSAARMALGALAAPGSPCHQEARAALDEALRGGDSDLRVLAASALGESGAPDVPGPLIAALDDTDPNVAAAAADALGELGAAEALEPLTRHAAAGPFWVRAAAVVALGRIRDARAIPALARAATTGGLEQPVIEALRSIGAPEALPVLESLHAHAPEPVLAAAGAILCAHPDVPAPEWVRRGARVRVDRLVDLLHDGDDPAAARLLGVAGTPAARDALFRAVGPPTRSQAALAGVLAVPEPERRAAILERLPAADTEERVALLPLLPAVHDDADIRRLIPLLSEDDAAVRAAAAEALGRAPAQRVLPLLEPALDRAAAPDVVRALGGLGGAACDALVPLLDDASEAVRTAAAEALTRCATAEVVAPLRRALDAVTDARSRMALLRALGRAGGEAAVERLAMAVEDDDARVRLAALDGLAATGSAAALPALRHALERGGAERVVAARAIADLGVAAAVPDLERFLRDPELELRRQAARGAIAVAEQLSAEAIDTMAADEDAWVRLCAARVAARRPSGREALERLARSDRDAGVRAEAQRMLERPAR